MELRWLYMKIKRYGKRERRRGRVIEKERESERDQLIIVFVE